MVAKGVLGHLIDSGGNNLQKFVRTMAGSGLDFVGKNPKLLNTRQPEEINCLFRGIYIKRILEV